MLSKVGPVTLGEVQRPATSWYPTTEVAGRSFVCGLGVGA